ncbi:hypothetical protein OL548_10770 [Lysinibacillus sp. MHQ-1]|nr:hypothetical protein OL548_10770 [Lysinibacillus sp. MHQ-1]
MNREEYRKIRDFGALLKFVYALNVSKRNVVHAIDMHPEEDYVQLNIYIKNNAAAEKISS